MLIHYNLELFSDATSRVMAVAVKYGATRLSRRTLDELDAWIGLAVLAAIDAPPPLYLITPPELAALTKGIQLTGETHEQEARAQPDDSPGYRIAAE